MVNVICGRILNDIGNKIIMLPDDIDVAEKLVVQIKEFVTGAISDAVSDLKYSLQGTTQGRYLTGGVPPVRFSM